ncbi:ABC transporter substrate-binding protein [Mesorhizobium delmotii]|uniref:Putative ABC-type dipeptide transport system, periplasmic component n=1 Tax=Mesorhizobium delmotii TaxID=1631247 RepID=A0A2P9AG89_9HYPH|nr:ABC transporter substrate-binding protein [Mesorhizobium delmotii]SJM30141.1 putative ABC-type dipeptide transport system, periplasmic component [Mesorhizobium delmotii]
MTTDNLLAKTPAAAALSRRHVLQLGAGLGIGAASGLLLGPKGALAQSPHKGGVARIATEISDATASLDPIKILTNTDIARAFQIYNTLVRIDEKLQVQPALAESFEMAKPDATEWVFKLRRDVTFHNGKTFTSSDVVWNINRHIDKKSESRAKSLLSGVREVKADGPETVRFVLNAPNVDFPVVLGMPFVVMAPEGQTDFSMPIGTGPFQMKEYTPGGTSSAVRYDGYWNADAVFLDGIEVVAIAEPANRLNAVLAGDLDFIMSTDVASLPLLDRSTVAEKVFVRAGQIVAIAMMCKQAPTNNNDLRLALKYLQDRERVRTSVYKGFAQIANDHPVSPIDPVYFADLPIRPYDVDKARFHLKKAGMENASLEVYVAPGVGPGLIDQMLLFQQTAAPAGLKIKVNQVPGAGYWGSVAGKHPLTSTHSNMRPRADLFWTPYMSSKAGAASDTGFVDSRIDNLLDAARAEVDVAKRKQHWCDLQTIIHEEGGYMEAAFPDYLHAKSRRLQGVVAHPMGGLSNFLSGEGWWFND